METQLFYYLYYMYIHFSVPKMKEIEKDKKGQQRQTFAYLYTGRQEIISSLVTYVTAQDN